MNNNIKIWFSPTWVLGGGTWHVTQKKKIGFDQHVNVNTLASTCYSNI